MTEEFDIMSAFQQIRQQLRDTRQPRNLVSIAEALQPTTFQLNYDGFTVPPLPPDLDWTAIRRTPNQYWTELELNLDEDEDDDNAELMNIMEHMAWAFLPEGIKDEICCAFYHGERIHHQILLTRIDPANSSPVITSALVEVGRDDFGTHLWLNGEEIAWYAVNDPLGDKDSPIFFDYIYSKLGRFFLGAAQLLWNALGHQVYIENERYIWDDETHPWETADDAELQNYVYNRIKQFGQLSGDFGVFKKTIRNARRRRNLY